MEPTRPPASYSAGYAQCHSDVLNAIEVELGSLKELRESGQEVPFKNLDDFADGIRYIMTIIEHLKE